MAQLEMKGIVHIHGDMVISDVNLRHQNTLENLVSINDSISDLENKISNLDPHISSYLTAFSEYTSSLKRIVKDVIAELENQNQNDIYKGLSQVELVIRRKISLSKDSRQQRKLYSELRQVQGKKLKYRKMVNLR